MEMKIELKGLQVSVTNQRGKDINMSIESLNITGSAEVTEYMSAIEGMLNKFCNEEEKDSEKESISEQPSNVEVKMDDVRRAYLGLLDVVVRGDIYRAFTNPNKSLLVSLAKPGEPITISKKIEFRTTEDNKLQLIIDDKEQNFYIKNSHMEEGRFDLHFGVEILSMLKK